jgi:hypothetical protein
LTYGAELDAMRSRAHVTLCRADVARDASRHAPRQLGSRRRASPDPLEPISETMWLVVRNALSQVLECSELAPRTDLRALLTAARDARLAADSTVTPP